MRNLESNDDGSRGGEELSPDRVRDLYEISKLLTRFKGSDAPVPAVLERLSTALGLHSAALILGERSGQRAQILVWPKRDAGAEGARAAEAHAASIYDYLSGGSHTARDRGSEIAPPPGASPRAAVQNHRDYIGLPLVVEHERVFGVLQLEPASRLREPDLLFANAIVNLLAIALDRQAVIESRQAAAAAEKARAEEQRDVAETLRRRFEALLDNLDHVFAWEADAENLRVSYVSARVEPLLGFPRERWLAAPSFWSECAHPEDLGRLLQTLEASFATDTNQRCEHRCIAADGRVIWLRTGVHLAHNSGGPMRLQGVSVDITPAKRLEEALRDADHRKNEFLAMLAHELRGPLAPIANAAQLLGLDSTDDARRQARAIIERQTGQMTRLVGDLLDVARITSGKIRLQLAPIAIDSVVEHAVETMRPFIAQRSHQLTVSLPAAPIWLKADAARLEQVVQNLLHNAAKYMPDGGRIDLVVRRERGDAVLSVRDTGVGIAPALLPHVFDLFTQAEGPLDRSRGGLGIGLALVKRLAVMHRGTVRVESTEGAGSEFVVRLPLASVAESTPAPSAPVPSDVPPLRILVVDDDVDTAQSLALLLEASGHIVTVAHGGLKALAVAVECRPQLALLDIGLPELDGYQVAKRLRLEPGLRDVVLVALTGYGRTQDLERSRAAGFDHYLVKPTDFARLREILRDIDANPTVAAAGPTGPALDRLPES